MYDTRINLSENERAEVGIDDKLLARNLKWESEESIFEMMNGCICCTVRDDLIVVLRKLAKQAREGLQLDGILIETTGLADPAPVAQTFFFSEDIAVGTLVERFDIESYSDFSAKSSNFRGLVLRCIKTDFCDQILIFQDFARSRRYAILCTAQISKFQQKLGKELCFFQILQKNAIVSFFVQ